MPRIQPLEKENAPNESQQLLTGIEKKMGRIPNIFKGMAHSPSALQAYLNFGQAMSTSVLSAKVREQIAIAVAETNNCNYCLSAHTAIGKSLGLSDEEAGSSRGAHSEDPKTKAILKLAQQIVESRGWLVPKDLEEARSAGIDDRELTEVIAVVAINLFTNYFNHIAETEVDFPEVAAATR